MHAVYIERKKYGVDRTEAVMAHSGCCGSSSVSRRLSYPHACEPAVVAAMVTGLQATGPSKCAGTLVLIRAVQCYSRSFPDGPTTGQRAREGRDSRDTFRAREAAGGEPRSVFLPSGQGRLSLSWHCLNGFVSTDQTSLRDNG